MRGVNIRGTLTLGWSVGI